MLWTLNIRFFFSNILKMYATTAYVTVLYSTTMHHIGESGEFTKWKKKKNRRNKTKKRKKIRNTNTTWSSLTSNKIKRIKPSRMKLKLAYECDMHGMIH